MNKYNDISHIILNMGFQTKIFSLIHLAMITDLRIIKKADSEHTVLWKDDLNLQ